MKVGILTAVLCAFYLNLACATENCIDTNDTYQDYDDAVKAGDIKNNPTEFYVLSYTWAPNHCKGKDADPGSRDYLQCGSGRDFGYILHGLWPQGTFKNPGNYPRACEGDQKKIDRAVLDKYLCMTPSVDLLQHEYENHGTCMHDENLEDPDVYFGKAFELHSTLALPKEEIADEGEGKRWFSQNNSHLIEDSVYFDAKTKEWRICYDRTFSIITCPGGDTDLTDTEIALESECKIKGNISKSSKKKYYFLESHPNYAKVKIDFGDGERCFSSESDAVGAGWSKAP